METNRKITVVVADGRSFFHVFGDNKKYYDLYSLTCAHKELLDYCQDHRYELESELLKQDELLENR